MFLNNPLKAYIYAYGLRAGLSFQFLKGVVDFLDVLKRPSDWYRRRISGKIWKSFPQVNLLGHSIRALKMGHEIKVQDTYQL